jgi:hypothetical protein
VLSIPYPVEELNKTEVCLHNISDTKRPLRPYYSDNSVRLLHLQTLVFRLGHAVPDECGDAFWEQDETIQGLMQLAQHAHLELLDNF